jgi:hypothetical protein
MVSDNLHSPDAAVDLSYGAGIQAVIRITSEKKSPPSVSQDGQFFAEKNDSAERPRQLVVTQKGVPVSKPPARGGKAPSPGWPSSPIRWDD